MTTDETSFQIEKPTLCGWDAHQTPFLKGVRCTACNEVAFPPQHYGCECCGSADHREEIIQREVLQRQIGRLCDERLLLKQARQDQPYDRGRRPEDEEKKTGHNQGLPQGAAMLESRKTHRAPRGSRGQSSQT